ncbi:uncharacterized protein LOC111697740 [Eurytemora carolleeae]|uniref:uncharacterized protein LOC111697740 n=1 Tax=Eurytemora carolleeae TaxID=1294199 RepID=UPI000C771017|nr:uncharacterized protein LOC111697740 [Eurytemora carolleeae]|eukprot:XP_023323612.1 uncharacterized protein LOC111697740 [Eurytemora affinis]
MWIYGVITAALLHQVRSCSSVQHPVLPTLFSFRNLDNSLCPENSDLIEECSVVTVNLQGLFSRKLLIRTAAPPSLSNSVTQDRKEIELEKRTEEGVDHILQDGSVSTLTYSSSYGPVEIIVKNKQIFGSVFWEGERYSIQPCQRTRIQKTVLDPGCHVWLKKKKKVKIPKTN